MKSGAKNKSKNKKLSNNNNNNESEDEKITENNSNKNSKNKSNKNNNKNNKNSPEKSTNFIDKKPLNPFFYFCQIQTKKYKNKNQDTPTFKELVEKWKNLSIEKMEKYNKKFKLLNENNKKESLKNNKKSNSSIDLKNIIKNHSISFDYSSNFNVEKKIRKSFSKITKNKFNYKLLKELQNDDDIKEIELNDDSILFKTKIKTIKKKNYIFNHKKYENDSISNNKNNKKK